MIFSRIVFQVNTHRLAETDVTSLFQDGSHDHWHDVISNRKVLLSGECTHSVCLAAASVGS